MFWQYNTFEYDRTKRAEIMTFLAAMKPVARALGAIHAYAVDFGEGKAANIICYPDRERAEIALERSTAFYEEAVNMGILKPGTLERRTGEVLFDYLA